ELVHDIRHNGDASAAAREHRRMSPASLVGPGGRLHLREIERNQRRLACGQQPHLDIDGRGVTDSMCAFSISKIRSGSWLPTGRELTFAPALAGMIVFGPGPLYPPQIPLISSVGRAEIRSLIVYRSSPQTAGTPVASRNCSSLIAPFAIISRSGPVNSTTSS